MVSSVEDRPVYTVLTPRERVHAGVAASGAIAILVLAWILVPDARGLGTHEELGLPPCMTLRTLGFPCPFCGMTTAFSHMAHGHPEVAVRTQPAGALAFFGAIAFAILYATMGVTGRKPAILENASLRKLLWRCGIGIVLVAWIYKLITFLG